MPTSAAVLKTLDVNPLPAPSGEGRGGGAPLAGREPRIPPGTHITVEGLRKSFAGEPVYRDFHLNLPRAQLTSVFGPNGCGKSTLINMMAGILPYEGGQILFDGKEVKDTRIGYVFQNYREALFPWRSSLANILYPLKYIGVSRAEGLRRVEKLVEQFDVRVDLKRYPYQLSGGQQQLVSIMRALVVEPEVLFMDEPFSALDYELTLLMRERLQRVLHERQVTTLLVSHDLEEAVYMADKVLLLTRRPTQIADFVDVPLPRPRTADMLVDDQFVALKRRCLDVFQRAVRGEQG
jgi:NitT/TauT family transport system ATP-binding protein